MCLPGNSKHCPLTFVWDCIKKNAQTVWRIDHWPTFSGSQRVMGVFVFACRFELLEVLNFDSVRRRMSVIVRSSSGRFLGVILVIMASLLRTSSIVRCWKLIERIQNGWAGCPHHTLYCSSCSTQDISTCSAKEPTHPSSPESSLGKWTGSEPGWSTMLWWVSQNPSPLVSSTLPARTYSTFTDSMGLRVFTKTIQELIPPF